MLGRASEAFGRLRADGLFASLGLTGTGHADSLREVIAPGGFDTVQVSYHLLNPGPAGGAPVEGETDYGNIMADCAAAAWGCSPSGCSPAGRWSTSRRRAHTLKTPYFPLALYEGDRERTRKLRESLAGRTSMSELAVRFALAHPAVCSAIIGFGSPAHVDEVAIIG